MSRSICNDRLTTAMLLLGLIAVWLATHPYRGIFHDARLYAVQALQVLSPGLYTEDLFFRYGSQESYTLFSRFYAQVIALTDLETATRGIVMGGQLLWLAALYLVARIVASGWEKWLFLFVVASWPTGYGDFTFHYSETFLSARLMAEIAVLGGIAALLSKRWLLAACAAALAAGIHPLVCLSGLLLALCYLGLEDRRWWLGAALAAAAAAALGWVGFQPFNGMWHQMDREWFELAYSRNRAVFVTQWGMDQLMLIVTNGILIGLAATALVGRRSRLMQAALLATALGVGANLVGSDWLGNTFMVQIQAFRILWLTQLIAYLALAVLLVDDSVPLKVRGWLVAAALAPPLTGLVLLAGYAALRRPAALAAVPARSSALLWAPLPATVTFWCLNWLAGARLAVAGRAADATLGTPTGGYLLQLLSASMIIAAALILFGLYAAGSRRAHRAATVGLMSVLVVTSVVVWDQRDPLRLELESTYSGDSSPLPPLPEGASIYWDDFHMNEVWLGARRPVYVSWLQGAGLLFSRQTAIEWKRRIERVSGRPFFEDGQREGEGLPSVGGDRLTVLCDDTALDYVVLRSKTAVEGTAFEAGGFPFYLYDCRRVGSNRHVAMKRASHEP